MKLIDIIQENNWLSIEKTLLSNYPDQLNLIETYQEIFESLKTMEPTSSSIELVVKKSIDDDDPTIFYAHVYGIDHESTNEYTNAVAIEFTPWSTWLGMEINKETLLDYSEKEIIAHSLYEMTFVGYDEDEIQGHFSEVKDVKEEYFNTPTDERNSKLKTLEQLLKELNIEPKN